MEPFKESCEAVQEALYARKRCGRFQEGICGLSDSALGPFRKDAGGLQKALWGLSGIALTGFNKGSGALEEAL